jgi:hypothetical protein
MIINKVLDKTVVVTVIYTVKPGFCFWRNHLKWMEVKIYVAIEIKYTKLILYYIKNIISSLLPHIH